MFGSRWVSVEATIIECFRTWGEPPSNARPWFEIVADVKTPAGATERVSSQQKLKTLTHRWRAPDPGEVVPARWDPARHVIRLALGGDLRYDEKLLSAIGRTRDPPTWPAADLGP